MKKLFYYADKYAAQSTWKNFALIKICLCAIGIIIGICIPSKNKKKAGFFAALAFVATYIPLMKGFIDVIKRNQKD